MAVIYARVSPRISVENGYRSTGIVIIQDGNGETVVSFLRVPICFTPFPPTPYPLSPHR